MARSKGDILKIQSSGFELEKSRVKGAIPDVPVEVKTSTLNITGEVVVSCSRSRFSSAFQYMFAEANADGSVPANTTYTLCPVSTRSRQSIPNLTRGKVYSIKASAIGPAGQSPFSNPVLVICQ